MDRRRRRDYAARMPASEVDLLNDLLFHELRSPVRRTAESHPFVDWASAADAQALADMRTEADGHVARLVQRIVEAGGAPRFAVPDPRAGGLHYLDVRYVLALLAADEQRLERLARQVLERLPADAPGIDLVADIRARHERNLAALRRMTGRVEEAPAAAGG